MYLDIAVSMSVIKYSSQQSNIVGLSHTAVRKSVISLIIQLSLILFNSLTELPYITKIQKNSHRDISNHTGVYSHTN